MSFKLLSFVTFLLPLLEVAGATRTITVTSTGSCSVSLSSAHVTVYNETDSAGATFLSTSTIHDEPASSSVSLFTSTNSLGSTVIGSTTVSVSPASSATGASASASASASARSSSASSGITNSQSSRSTLAATSTSAISAASPSAPCPQAAFAQIYNSRAGAVWQIFCSADVYYYDLPSVTTDSFEECIDACDAYQPSGSYKYPCVAVTWTAKNGPGSNCQLKYGVNQVIYGTSNYCSAKLASYVLPPDFPVSIVSSYASVATPSTATTSLTFATGTQVQTYETASPCPLTNGSTYTPPDGSNVAYEIFCGVSLKYNDLESINVGSFEDCMAACNAWVPAPPGAPFDQPCIAVTYIGYDPQLPSCFRHYATNHNSVQNDHPYGDSAVRQDKASRLEGGSRKRGLLEGGFGSISKKVLPEELLEVKAMLAQQGIILKVRS